METSSLKPYQDLADWKCQLSATSPFVPPDVKVGMMHALRDPRNFEVKRDVLSDTDTGFVQEGLLWVAETHPLSSHETGMALWMMFTWYFTNEYHVEKCDEFVFRTLDLLVAGCDPYQPANKTITLGPRQEVFKKMVEKFMRHLVQGFTPDDSERTGKIVRVVCDLRRHDLFLGYNRKWLGHHHVVSLLKEKVLRKYGRLSSAVRGSVGAEDAHHLLIHLAATGRLDTIPGLLNS